jgi:hypothetical protein
MNGVKAAAVETLRSDNFFSVLRGALRTLGLAGREGWMGLAVYFVASSRFQAYPLRLEIRERTEGTAAYAVRRVSILLPPGSVVIITPGNDEEWARFAKAPGQKTVLIRQWETREKGGLAQVDVQGNKIIRRKPVKTGDRFIEQLEEIEGRFACISGERPWARNTRWLTMVQAERREVESEATSSLRERETEDWHQVQRLLEQRALLPVVLPEWEQIVVEQMCERDDRAMRHVPAVLQMWRTMCLIRSFRSEENNKARYLQATFEDLAAASLLARKVFREGQWFPSCKKIFGKLGKSYDRTRVMHPVTGKPVVYERREEEVAVRWESLI